MKATLITIGAMAIMSFSYGQTNPDKPVHVKHYEKKDGTQVPPHDRTPPNKTKKDNWSTEDNTNPKTGKKGTKPAIK